MLGFSGYLVFGMCHIPMKLWTEAIAFNLIFMYRLNHWMCIRQDNVNRAFIRCIVGVITDTKRTRLTQLYSYGLMQSSGNMVSLPRTKMELLGNLRKDPRVLVI